MDGMRAVIKFTTVRLIRILFVFLGNYNAFNVPNSELIGLDGALNPNAQLKYADDLTGWIRAREQDAGMNTVSPTIQASKNLISIRH